MSRSKNDKASKKNRNTFRDDKLEEIKKLQKIEKEAALNDEKFTTSASYDYDPITNTWIEVDPANDFTNRKAEPGEMSVLSIDTESGTLVIGKATK